MYGDGRRGYPQMNQLQMNLQNANRMPMQGYAPMNNMYNYQANPRFHVNSTADVKQWNNSPSYNFAPVPNMNIAGGEPHNRRHNPMISTPGSGKRSHSQQSSRKTYYDDDDDDVPQYKKQKTKMSVSLKDDINGKITGAIWKYFEKSRQSDSMYKQKVDLRDALYIMLKENFPYCGLYMVGSSMSGFATRTSDMDLCLMISNSAFDAKKEVVEVLMAIQTALRKSRFVRKSQLIRARVPILKFEDYKNGIECDLNINNSVGIRNTHLLRYYASMDWRVRPLVLFMKKWARFHDINDASKKTISSYSLCLMMIHYLQAGCKPPVLDSVQKLYPDLFDFGSDIRNLKMNVKIEFKSKNSDSVGTLFLGFLQYYTKQFSFSTDVASIRQGTRLPYHLVQSWTPAYDQSMWKCLKVEEPFDKSNTARSCYDEGTFARIMRVIARSHRELSIKRDVEAILSKPF